MLRLCRGPALGAGPRGRHALPRKRLRAPMAARTRTMMMITSSQPRKTHLRSRPPGVGGVAEPVPAPPFRKPPHPPPREQPHQQAVVPAAPAGVALVAPHDADCPEADLLVGAD